MNGPTFLARRQTRLQRGVAAVELALLMSALVIIMIPTFVIARALWQYTVLKQATDNAARYFAALPLYQLAATNPDPRDMVKQMVAKTVVDAGLIPATSEEAFLANIEVSCPGIVNCKSGTPVTVVVGAYMSISDPSTLALNGSPWKFQTISTVPYGN